MEKSAPAKTTKDGRRARGDRSRAQILECAARLASVEGLSGLSIGQVAAEAGTSKGNIQCLFGDKEGLQLAILDWAVNLYTAAVVEPALQKPGPLARLRALVEGWFAFVEYRALPGGCLVTAAGSEFRARPGRLRDLIESHRAQMRDRLLEQIKQAQAQGEIVADADAAQIAFDLMAYQAIANVASVVGDMAEFERARKASRERIRQCQLPA